MKDSVSERGSKSTIEINRLEKNPKGSNRTSDRTSDRTLYGDRHSGERPSNTSSHRPQIKYVPEPTNSPIISPSSSRYVPSHIACSRMRAEQLTISLPCRRRRRVTFSAKVCQCERVKILYRLLTSIIKGEDVAKLITQYSHLHLAGPLDGLAHHCPVHVHATVHGRVVVVGLNACWGGEEGVFVFRMWVGRVGGREVSMSMSMNQ